jgi:chaperonin cofactor prefoldin
MTTQGANFQKVQRTGRNNNIITPEGSSNGRSTGVAELSSHEDIQERDLDPETDIVVEELGEDPRIRQREEGERVIKVNTESLANSRLSKFFTDTEIAELEKKESVVTGEDKETTYEEAMAGLKADLKERNRQVARERRAKEVKRAKEELKKGTKYDREVSDLSGEEFKELIAEANENPNSDPKSEELEAAIDQINEKYAPMLEESEPEINQPEIEELEEGTQAWKEIGGYWEELANDVEASSELPDTAITTLSDGKKLVKTSYDELKSELRQVDNNPDKEGEIVDKQGEVITARVSEGDKF